MSRPRAYSYTRFSTPEQAKGDSYRRQTKKAEEYARRHGLRLDKKLKLHDPGVSAFRGANAATGSFNAFLEAVRVGEVEPGSRLIVESLDRVSRQTPWDTIPILQALINAGITLVTLSPEREYTPEQVQGDMMPLMELMVYAARAHEESLRKSDRLQEVWKAKRERARENGEAMTDACPAWLEKDGDSFRVLEDRAEIVRRIFAEYLDGTGYAAIARNLNDEGVPNIGRSDRWSRTYTSKILANPAVLGKYTPHKIKKGKRVPAGDPIPDYYPEIVDPDTFEAVQRLRRSRRGQRSTSAKVRNLFAYLGTCGRCEGTVTRVNKSSDRKGRSVYLVCKTAKVGGDCEHESIPYDEAERMFLRHAPDVIRQAPAGQDVDPEIEQTRRNVMALEEQVETTVDVLTRTPSPALERRLGELEEALQEARSDLATLLELAEESRGPLVRKRLDALAEALAADPLDRKAANAALRQTVERVTADFDAHEFVLHWRHGGKSRCPYSAGAYGFDPVPEGESVA